LGTLGITHRAACLRGFVALAVAMGIGRFAFTPQLPVMQADLGLSLKAGGWLATANYLGYLIGAMMAGRRALSAHRLIRWGLLAVVASTTAMALPGPWTWWLAMRFIAGVASAWVMVGTASVLLSRLAATAGTQHDGLVFAGVGAGIACAGLVCHIGLWAGFSAATLWLLLAALALLGAGIVLTTGQSLAIQGEVNAAPQTLSSRNPSRTQGTHPWVVVLCYGLYGFGYILPATYLPSQARLLLGEPALFGWIWPVFGLAAALSTLAVARLGHWPRKRVWALAQCVMAAGVLLPAVMSGLTGLALAALCVGGTFMLITLIGLQEARHLAGSRPQGLLAAMTAAFAFGQLSGPLLANLLLTMGATFNATLWLGACALLISSVLLVCLADR